MGEMAVESARIAERAFSASFPRSVWGEHTGWQISGERVDAERLHIAFPR